MKRASLKVVPAAAPKEPTDLTDRLLDREAERTPLPARAKRAASPAKPPAAKAAPKAIEPGPSPTVVAAPPTAHAASAEPGKGVLAGALDQAQAASQALEAAAQEAPARYSVALRYRLEALAQHLRQVSEFVQRLGNQR